MSDTPASIDALRRRTRAVVLCGSAACALALASAAAVMAQVRATRAPTMLAVDLAAVERADRLAVGTGIALTAATLLGLALWALWAREAWRLADSLGVRSLTRSARSAAWSFVLPVVQFWRPFLALAELARALDHQRPPPSGPRAAADASGHYRENAAEPAASDRPLPPVPVGAWWAFWVAGWALSYVAGFARSRVATPSDLRTSLWIDLTSQLFLALAAFFAARVAVALKARLHERAARGAVAA